MFVFPSAVTRGRDTVAVKNKTQQQVLENSSFFFRLLSLITMAWNIYHQKEKLNVHNAQHFYIYSDELSSTLAEK